MAILNHATDPAPILEKAVRPFSSDPPKPRAARVEPDQPPPEAQLVWSAKTNVEATTIPALGFRVNTREEWTETSRDTFIQRVTNPEDDSQYVDVERVRALYSKNKDGRSSRIRYKD